MVAMMETIATSPGKTTSAVCKRIEKKTPG